MQFSTSSSKPSRSTRNHEGEQRARSRAKKSCLSARCQFHYRHSQKQQSLQGPPYYTEGSTVLSYRQETLWARKKYGQHAQAPRLQQQHLLQKCMLYDSRGTE